MAAEQQQQQQQLVLLHGAGHVELDAGLATRRGGLRALEREAERAFGLPPQSFGLYARGGRVESPEALQRALEASAGGPCRLELREHAEWRALNRAAEALEGRLMAKVEAALAGVREDLARTEARLDRGLAPVVQSLALEQIDLRTSVEALRGLAPMVQSVAMEQLEVREKLAAQEAAAAPPPPAAAAPQLVMLCAPAGGKACAAEEELGSAAAALKDLEALEQQLRQDLGGRLGAVEQADEYLFSELQAMRDCAKIAERDVEELRAGLQGLERQQRERAEEAKDSARPKHAAGNPDAWLSWSEGLPAGIPYSGKAVVVDFQKGAAHGRRGGAAAGKRAGADLAPPPEGLAPFARASPLRPLERAPGCQSLPLLPPLR